MKYLTALSLALLVGCSTAPSIVPDSTSESVILKKINHEIANGSSFQTGWQWILWYLPIVFLVGTWGWKQWIRNCTESEEELAELKAKVEEMEKANKPQDPQLPHG